MSAKRVQGAVIVIWSALAEVDFSEGDGGKELREDLVDEDTKVAEMVQGRRPNLTIDGCPRPKEGTGMPEGLIDWDWQ
jgi:hypothetical protein